MPEYMVQDPSVILCGGLFVTP